METFKDHITGMISDNRSRFKTILGKSSELSDLKVSELSSLCEQIRETQNDLQVAVSDLNILFDKIQSKMKDKIFISTPYVN